MTSSQSAALAAARRVAARNLGLLDAFGRFDSAAIPYAKTEAYATELARVILSAPQNFDALTVAIASRELNDKPNEPLTTTTATDRARVFLGEFGNQALAIGDAAAGIGEGVKTTLAAGRWAIPAAAAVFVGILLYREYRRARA